MERYGVGLGTVQIITDPEVHGTLASCIDEKSPALSLVLLVDTPYTKIVKLISRFKLEKQLFCYGKSSVVDSDS
jgi:hypothetical protein